jgi:hypothetical protein
VIYHYDLDGESAPGYLRLRLITKVLFYSGYKGLETPRAIVAAGQEFPIDKIIWRRRSQDKETCEPCEIIRCRAAGQELTLKVSPSGECRILGRVRLIVPS